MKKEKKDIKELGQRLQNLINGKGKKGITKSTGQNETTNADGGYLVERELVPDIFAPNFTEGSLYRECKIFNVGEMSNGIKIPIANEPTRDTSGIKGGVLAYWVKEGITKTASKAQFAQLNLGLNKLVGVVYATDELIQDAPALQTYISGAVSEEILWQVDRGIIYGNGAQLNGIVNDASTIAVTASDPITVAQLKDMYHAYYGSVNGAWYMSKNGYEEIIDLDLTTSPNIFDPTPSEGAPMGRIMGLPIVVTDVMNGDDVLLADLSQYCIAQKEMTSDVNQSLKFLEDESVFRWVLRINGKSGWNSTMTLQDGSVVSPFVIKTDMEQSTSSSSSFGESSSSSELNSESSSSSSVDSSSSYSSDGPPDFSSSSSSVDSSSSSSSSGV